MSDIGKACNLIIMQQLNKVKVAIKNGCLDQIFSLKKYIKTLVYEGGGQMLELKDIKEQEEDIREMDKLLRNIPTEYRDVAKGFMIAMQIKDEKSMSDKPDKAS